MEERVSESKLYGTLGVGTKAANKYGKRKWFFSAERERMLDGSPGPIVYVMPAKEAPPGYGRLADASSQPFSLVAGPSRIGWGFFITVAATRLATYHELSRTR